MADSIRIHPKDTVAVALRPLNAGEVHEGVTLLSDIPQGHKFALQAMAEGENVIKYGLPIGHAKMAIAAGDHVHTHNVASNLSDLLDYTYTPDFEPVPARPAPTFMGYRRADGRAAVRNEIWIIPTVGCVNAQAQQLCRMGRALMHGSVDAVVAFPHPYGCSQMGDDQDNTRALLCDLIRHPNAAGVLVLGLGCENSPISELQKLLTDADLTHVRFLETQAVPDEFEAGESLLRELIDAAATAEREPIPASELIVGLKCGGSDGLSGITANPVIGRFSDRLIGCGGATVLTEVPEMFGAETLLMQRCVNEEVFRATVDLINGFKQYFKDNGQTIDDNPSPGNKAGGITTLEDKALGCTQKAGDAPVMDVLPYGGRVRTQGLSLLYAPGNDLVASTALAAAGCHIVLFSTGRGTPFGSPVPTVKIASNTPLARHKAIWIDFDAGPAAEGVSLDDLGDLLMAKVLSVASGETVKAEQMDAHDMAIFKQGVTL